MNYQDKTLEELMKIIQEKDDHIQQLEKQLSFAMTAEDQQVMFASGSDLLIILNRAGIIEFVVNSSILALYGWSTDDLQGRSILDLIHDDDKALMESNLKVLSPEKTFVEMETKILNPDNSVRWFIWDIYFTEKKNALYVIGKDITDSRLLQVSLDEKEKVFHDIFNSIQDGLVVMDSDYNIILCNSTLRQWYSHVEPIIGAKCYDIFCEHSLDKNNCLFDETFNLARPVYKEIYRKLTGLDEYKWLGIYSFPLVNELHDKPVGIIAYVKDITHDKISAQELVANEKKLKAILNNIPDMAWLKDKECRYIAVNDAMKELMGFTDEDMLYNTVYDILTPELAKRHMDMDKKVLETGERSISEEFLTDIYGNIHWLEMIKTAVTDENGVPIGIAGVARDITERKIAQEEIHKKNEILAEQNAQLEEFNNFKNELLGIAAHDLRNPLTTIKNISSFLLMQINDPLSPEQVMMINLVQESCEKMLQLINSLLSVSAIESGKIQLNKEKIKLYNLINVDNSLVKIMAQQKNLIISINLPDDLPEIELDPVRFNQVFENILYNAVTYSLPETTINISARVEGDRMIISISDQGPGISPTLIGGIFQPYKIVESNQLKTAQSAKASGLGLAIAKKIVEMHSGSISVNSKINNGTEFIISLPLY